MASCCWMAEVELSFSSIVLLALECASLVCESPACSVSEESNSAESREVKLYLEIAQFLRQ